MDIKNTISSASLNVPILFLVFNRLDTAKKVLMRIRKVRPSKFYIACDGPRLDHAGETKEVDQIRKYILSQIDWECEVKTLFRENNLGCMMAVSSAISWFFSQEEMGIILEDDCLPSNSFFYYCQELLYKYKDDMRIWHIGGYRHPDLLVDNYSYDFSRYASVWGWASWANRWEHYDVNMREFSLNPDIMKRYSFFETAVENKDRAYILPNVLNGKINTWDYQWDFTVRINNGLAIRPSKNLIHNIGFGENATHTFKADKSIRDNLECDIELPLTHPSFMMVNSQIDSMYFHKHVKPRMCSRMKSWVKRVLRKA